jgi:hypothetical protein
MKNQEKDIIKTKICRKCISIKNIKCFGKRNIEKDGYHYNCKECLSKEGKENQYKNKEYQQIRSKKLKQERLINKEKKIKEIFNTKTKVCNKCNIEKHKEEFHNSKINLDRKLGLCIECKRREDRIYSIKNKNKRRQYEMENREMIRKSLNKYKRKRYKTDILFKTGILLRSHINKNVKKFNIKKCNSILTILGCTLEEYKQHLEKQFLPEMTWDNHGDIWEIDHIIPCSSFNLLEESEQLKCFHYLNTQPLFKTTEIAEQFGYTNQRGNRNKSNNL